ncbi:DegT/DnrJ/EryC1/StrS aminotransferase family protein [Clostridium perfringens]|nr:DegT/DnrJ/EryC1/StrS aminotransferase family protein [Clostridium perfringens]
MIIPFSPPDIREEEIKNVIEVLKSGWITTGPKTKEFERKISEYCGTEKAICLNSATAGLEMVLRILGVGEGDEVITSAYTYTASASVIAHVGAKIVLIDTDKDSYHMDYQKLESAITEKTKVIIPVDIAGVMCDYDRIFEIVENKKNIFKANNDIQKKFNRCIVLADGAHSFGASYKGKKSGNVADFTSFSFHAVKNLTTAEGGAVTWTKKNNLDSEKIYNSINNLSLHGQTKDALAKTKVGAWEYDIETTGYKCNMTDVMAAIGLAQLERYDKLLNRRKEIINKYNNELLKCEKVSVLEHYNKNINSSGHLYLVRVKDINESKRNEIINFMANNGISTNVHYKPLPLLTAYKKLGFNIKDYPNSLNMYKNEITFPLHTLLSDNDILYIIDCFKEILKGLK